jgi:hypothetical protein
MRVMCPARCPAQLPIGDDLVETRKAAESGTHCHWRESGASSGALDKLKLKVRVASQSAVSAGEGSTALRAVIIEAEPLWRPRARAQLTL